MAGSQAPLADCYRPDLVPDEVALARGHAAMAGDLKAAGADLILVETMNTAREAVAAARAASATGLPFLMSFVCGTDGRLLSGQDLGASARAVLLFRPSAVLVNCTPAPAVLGCLAAMKAAVGSLPIGAYANTGHADPKGVWVSDGMEDPEAYAACVKAWIAAGARLVGGCCGTTPAHIRCLARLRV